MQLSAPPLGHRAAGPAPAAAGPRPARPRLYVLDGLRLAAALSVLLFHYAGKPSGYDSVWGTTPDRALPLPHRIGIYGWLGVDLFFLISGFVICMSCWGKQPRDFFVSRVVRLYPAYWAAVALTTAVVLATRYPFSRPEQLTVRNVLVNLTMVQAPLGAPAVDPSYWTLWVEMVFYALFALVVLKGLSYRRVVLFCLVWTFASAVASGVDEPLLQLLAGPSYAPYFVAGVAMYLVHRFGPNLLLLGIVAFSWLTAQYRLPGMIGVYQQWLPDHISWSVCAAVVTGWFLLVLGAALGWFGWVRWSRLTAAGALTYPLYLLHQQIGTTLIHLLVGYRLPPTTVLPLTVGAMLLLAWLLHRLVERPLAGRLKRRLTLSFEAVAGPLRAGSPAAAGEKPGDV